MSSAGKGTSTGQASGRLDLLGGVADYSGALVLEIPTRATTTVTIEPAAVFEIGPATFTRADLNRLATLPYPEIRAELAGAPKSARYPIGVALVLVRHGVIAAPTGRVTIESDVPMNAGVSSSAALEVATARALGATGDPIQIATLCQEAENHVVGAPCGIMDQVTVAAGRPGQILPILCRPASIDPGVSLPAGVEVVGWPTDVAHDVSGRPYGRARAAAFMGKRIAETAANETWTWVSDVPATLLDRLPETLTGAEFIARWSATDDPLSLIEPAEVYPVRAATAFGVGEHQRTRAVLALVRGGEAGGLGPLLAASHAGYDAAGLGHPTADEVVARALARPGVHGARSSGGGCGGTVVVLCDVGALDDVPGLIR